MVKKTQIMFETDLMWDAENTVTAETDALTTLHYTVIRKTLILSKPRVLPLINQISQCLIKDNAHDKGPQ